MRDRVEKLMWGSATVTAALAFLWLPPRAGGTPEPSSHVVGTADFQRVDAGILMRSADDLVRSNPFRLTRRPADPVPEAIPEPEEFAEPLTVPPRYQLLLSGTLGGPPWEALIDGIPGREHATLFREGQTIDGFTARRITPDTVVVTVEDTTFVLLPKRPWQ